MSTRKTKKRRLKKYPVGDMRNVITIYDRTITPPGFDSVSYDETFDNGEEEWADIETGDSIFARQVLFDDVDQAERSTHSFVIRFDDSRVYTSENYIEFDGNRYKILGTSNPEHRDEYQELFSRLMGDKDLPANE